MTGDSHVRLRERLGVKFPWATRQYFCGFEFFQHELPIDPSSPPAGRQAEGRACHAGSSELRSSRPGPR